MSKSLLCDNGEKYKEGLDPTVLKLNNQTARKNSETATTKKEQKLEMPKAQSYPEDAMSIKLYNVQGVIYFGNNQ